MQDVFDLMLLHLAGTYTAPGLCRASLELRQPQIAPARREPRGGKGEEVQNGLGGWTSSLRVLVQCSSRNKSYRHVQKKIMINVFVELCLPSWHGLCLAVQHSMEISSIVWKSVLFWTCLNFKAFYIKGLLKGDFGVVIVFQPKPVIFHHKVLGRLVRWWEGFVGMPIRRVEATNVKQSKCIVQSR